MKSFSSLYSKISVIPKIADINWKQTRNLAIQQKTLCIKYIAFQTYVQGYGWSLYTAWGKTHLTANFPCLKQSPLVTWGCGDCVRLAVAAPYPGTGVECLCCVTEWFWDMLRYPPCPILVFIADFMLLLLLLLFMLLLLLHSYFCSYFVSWCLYAWGQGAWDKWLS